MILSNNLQKKQEACRLLQKKASELGCRPKKADLSEVEFNFVKAHLGPFPRALEQAGLKPPKQQTERGKKRENLEKVRLPKNRETAYIKRKETKP